MSAQAVEHLFVWVHDSLLPHHPFFSAGDDISQPTVLLLIVHLTLDIFLYTVLAYLFLPHEQVLQLLYVQGFFGCEYVGVMSRLLL